MKNNNGQSAIEFLISFSILLGFTMFFLKLGMNYTNGYLAHYANFMASRAFLVVDINSNQPAGSDAEAEKRASDIFKKFNLAGYIPGFESELKANSPDFDGNKIFVGTYVEFSQKLSTVSSSETINYYTESFLGREPTRAECIERVCQAMTELGTSCGVHITFYDNGC